MLFVDLKIRYKKSQLKLLEKNFISDCTENLEMDNFNNLRRSVNEFLFAYRSKP